MSAAVLGLGGVDMGAACLDDDRFADAADLERERADRQPLAGAEHDVLALERAETLRATTRSVYMPGCRLVTWKSPCASLTTTRGSLVASLMTVTVAPGMTCPCASVTVPEMVPVTAWARRDAGQQHGAHECDRNASTES